MAEASYHRPREDEADWWLAGGINPANCIAAYQPKGAASYAASKVNLANPGTYNAYEGTAPGWDTTKGWLFTPAASKLLKTDIVPPCDGTWSMIWRFTDAVMHANNPHLSYINNYYMNRRFGFAMGSFPNLIRYYRDSPNGTNGGSWPQYSTHSGVQVVAGSQGYLDGATDGTEAFVHTPSGTNAMKLMIGGWSHDLYAPNGLASFQGEVVAGAIYNTEITSDQVTALTTAINAL